MSRDDLIYELVLMGEDSENLEDLSKSELEELYKEFGNDCNMCSMEDYNDSY